MLAKPVIRRLQKTKGACIDPANPIVFVGPNHSRKTSALRALALRDAGLRLELGYGLNGPGGRGLWVPYLAYREGNAAELHVGARLDLGEAMRLEFSALRRRGGERQGAGFQVQGGW